MTAHPDDHVGDAGDGDEGQHALHDLPLLEGEVLADDAEDDRDTDAQGDRDGDPEPHRSDRFALASLDQEGGDDADDQGGLDAFAETDHERGQHAGGSPSLSRGFAGRIMTRMFRVPNMHHSDRRNPIEPVGFASR